MVIVLTFSSCQYNHMAEKTLEELTFYAAVLYGQEEKVKTITKRLSLFK